MSVFSYASPPSINLRGGRVMWEPSMGSSDRLPNRYRGNGYANRYPSNRPMNRISMVTNNRNKALIVASSVYISVRLKASTVIYVEDSSRQRGRPIDTRLQISDSNIPTGNNIWSQAPQVYSIPKHTVSRKVTSTSTVSEMPRTSQLDNADQSACRYTAGQIAKAQVSLRKKHVVIVSQV
jgi:hypothetical protein